jgi:hypothetical protein
MALVRSAARIARATELRNLAVDLVALRGAVADADDGGKTIQVMMFEGDRLSVLYKTQRVTLSNGRRSGSVSAKGFHARRLVRRAQDHVRPLGPRRAYRCCGVQAGRMGRFDRKGAVGEPPRPVT